MNGRAWVGPLSRIFDHAARSDLSQATACFRQRALAGYAVPRRADATGTISIYNRRHYIGTINKRKMVYVMFDPETYDWLIADEEGRQLSRPPATYINRVDIRNLMVSLRDTRTVSATMGT